MKKYFLPRDDAGKVAWLANFTTKLVVHATAVGVTPAELTMVQQANALVQYTWAWCLSIKTRAMDVGAYKNILFVGNEGPLQAFPGGLVNDPLPAGAGAVLAGVFPRISRLASRIKKHTGYTAAIGEDLGIEGVESAPPDLASAKPILTIVVIGGQPVLKWKRGEFDALEIEVDRGDGFKPLAVDTVPDYADTHPLPAPGQSALWRYRAIYRLGDARVGQWGDVLSQSVTG